MNILILLKLPSMIKWYTTITFKEGVTLDDLESLQEVTPIFKGEGETAPTLYTKFGQKVDGVEQTTPIKSAKDFKEIKQKFTLTVQELRSKDVEVDESRVSNPKVYSVSFNHDPEDEEVKSFKALTGEKSAVSAEKKQALLSKLAQAKQTRDSKLDASPARDVLTPEGLEEEIEEITSASNKELMDIIYPPQEQIDELNEEIKEERREYLEFEREKEQKPIERIKKVLQNIQSFIYNPVQALRLSNYNGHLVIYPDAGPYLRVDLPNDDKTNGNQLQLNPDNGSYAQDFYFADVDDGHSSRNEVGEIRMYRGGNKCLDIEGGEHWVNGTDVQVYDCNDSPAQKWEAWPDRTIRPTVNKTKCLDASAGLLTGSPLQIWECDSSNIRQKFLIGENDFSNWNLGRYMRIQSTPATSYILGLVGHTSVSVGMRNLNNKGCWTTNAFSNWPGPVPQTDWEFDNNDTNDLGRTNNIRTGNNINVDKFEDWDNAITDKNWFRYRDLSISKQKYDEIKYMNGYYIWYKDFWNETVQGYNLYNRNCSTYSRDLWWNYTGEWHNLNAPHTPTQIYNSIGDYNWDGQSQCYVGI